MGSKQSGLSWPQIECAAAGFKRNWVNGVVITGGEPTCCDDLIDLIRFFKEMFGFAVKLDTNGSNPDKLVRCLPLVDYVAMDVKCALPSYPEVVNFSDIETIRRSINLIRSEARDYEFRTTVIDALHTNEQMDAVGEAIEGARRYALQAFVPREDLPDKVYRDLPRTTSARLHQLKERMQGCADEILLRGA
jgi:pyruvate formate lyase activating enzyme